MKTLTWIAFWLIAIGVGWAILGGLIGAVIAVLVLLIGMSPTAVLLLILSVIAIAVGGVDYVRSDR